MWNSPASVQIPLTSAPEQFPIFSANARKLIPRCKDICSIKILVHQYALREMEPMLTDLSRMNSQNRHSRFRSVEERRVRKATREEDESGTDPGGGNSIFRSIRPGRKSAESRISIRFVAMMTWVSRWISCHSLATQRLDEETTRRKTGE